MDAIEITGLTAWGHHGVLDHERALGQEFVVDVRLSVDLSAAAASDDLADTVDYGVLAQQVHDVVTGEPCDLIEALAGRIADRCLADPRVLGADVTVRKPSAPLTVPARHVAVTVRRRRTPGPAGS